MGTKTQKLSNVVDQIVEWQPVFTGDGSTGLTAVAGRGYFIDTTSGTVTVTLPASPKAGDTIAFKDYAGTFGTNSLTIARNGNNIQGVANDSVILTNRASVVLVYIDATKGWLYTNESNVADLQDTRYVTATGGTVTESGDYKIHTFTGDGCFVVSCAGTPAGSSSVDYLVLGGGGAGGTLLGGGGGGGGYRESVPSPAAWTASPLANPGGSLPVTTQGYPVTVGGGGTGAATFNGVPNAGSPSTFSTITSAGGGYGGSPSSTSKCGGSGGGGSYSQATGGTGNTPPVSPPQGNDGGGGLNGPVSFAGGGGGGAGAAGTAGTAPTGGPGGNGVASSITGSPVTRGGGGGGSGSINNDQPGGSGGSGGGGQGQRNSPAIAATNGTANLGGGGGGRTNNPTEAPGTNGGKGIVIIRYKFQN